MFPHGRDNLLDWTKYGNIGNIFVAVIDAKMRQNLEQLVNQDLAEDDEMEILKQILDDERRRHGISSPMDG